MAVRFFNVFKALRSKEGPGIGYNYHDLMAET